MKKSLLYLLGFAALMTACQPKPDTERLVCAEADMQEFPYQKNGLPVIDLHSLLTDRADMTADMIHPNEKGAGKMAEKIAETIKK